MNSRFKFIQSVNPQSIPTNAVKPKFSKLTLATSKTVAIESVNEQKDRGVQAPQTVTCVRTTTTTTTTTTMTRVLDNAPAQDDMDDIPSAQQQQQQKILLYESTRDETQSALLTDDDTNSVNSSLDSKDLETGLKEITQPTQDTVTNVDQIDTQMQSLSFISTLDRHNVSNARNDDGGMHNISRQLEQLDILNDEEAGNESVDDKEATQRRQSIVSLSSNDDTLDHESDELENTQEKNGPDSSSSVIVLSDSDTEEAEVANEPSPTPKRNISQEPPLKPTMPSSNDPAMYNISSIDSSSMQRVNNFFDNAPFIEPVEPVESVVENSFNSSHVSRSQKEDIYVPETTDEESLADDSNDGASIQIDGKEKEKEKSKAESKQEQQIAEDLDEAHESRKLDFSDNNIIVDIPVKKSTSDQPRQLIRSQSGVRLTASRSSPITKTSSGKIDSDGIKRTSSNVILKTPGNCGFTVNSSNGQLNIAAKININIQIVEDSSEESSEDNKPVKKSPAIQSSEDCASGRNTNTNDVNSDSLKPTQSGENQSDSKNNRTPVKKSKLDAVNKTPKTPQTASKLKQFEFVPPKSMTKAKKVDDETENGGKPLNKSITSESSENDGFQIDKNIPISPRDQKLLHKVYGEAWKTPDVIRSYSAVKGKRPMVDRAAGNSTPSALKNRYSKGFDLFKQKLKTNLNSTTLDEHAEISIIETPKHWDKFKSPRGNGMKPPQNTPRTNYKTAIGEKDFQLNQEPSPSVLTKRKPSPKSNKKNLATPKTDNAGSPPTSSRPQRSVRRKRIIYSDDDDASEKENARSGWTDDSNYSCSVSESELLTDDNSDEEQKDVISETPKSVRGKKPTGSTTKRLPKKKANKNDLIYLDLSAEEIVQVDENFHSNVSEQDLANITRKFLETDLNDADEKPKKKTGRKLFTHKYDDLDEVDETNYESEPKSVKKKPVEEADLIVEIPKFTHKLFDSKIFGSPSTTRTPTGKNDIKIDEFKTPSISRILAERKTPFGSAKSRLDSPPKTFTTYGFLKSLDVQASMVLCHPDAKKFRENFKAHKEELTTILYKLFNEKVFENKLNIDVIWNKKLLTTAGRFHGQKRSSKLTGKNHRVELSEKVLTSADRLRCTFIHELCHAATWIFHGERGHGACWKAYAKKANCIFPELPIITTCHNYDIQYKYTYKCDMCHHKSQSHSKSKKVENIRCSYCHGMISIFLNKKGKDGKIIMEPVREAKGFAKYVKEQYKEFKKPGVKHADVMRQISLQYSTLSQEEKEKY